MKKLIALLLTLAMMVCFAACGGEEKPAEGDKNTTQNTPGTVEEIDGETYDAGNVSVQVPDGWKAFPVSDMWSEDSTATDPDQVNVVKGGETEFDLLSKPYIQIVHYEPNSMITPSKDYYDTAEDVAPITTGNLTWEGFQAEGMLGDTFILLWTTNADGHQFQVNVFNETDGGTITLDDADVQAILASISNS